VEDVVKGDARRGFGMDCRLRPLRVTERKGSGKLQDSVSAPQQLTDGLLQRPLAQMSARGRRYGANHERFIRAWF